jgi:hypothetical protein
MTLILWKAPVVREAEEAEALLESWYESGDESAFEPSRDVKRFLDEIRAHYPDDFEGGADDLSPWSSWPIPESDRIVELGIRWSASNSAIETIEDLARTFGLLLYDPQGPEVHLPDDPIDTEPTPPPSLMDAVKFLPLAILLLALTYAAWLIPIGWIRWPAVIVAGFVALAGLFVLWLVLGSALGLIKDED